MDIEVWLKQSISHHEQILKSLEVKKKECDLQLVNRERFLQAYRHSVESAECTIRSLEEMKSRHLEMLCRAKDLGYQLSSDHGRLDAAEHHQEAWLDEAIRRAKHRLDTLIHENPPYEAEIKELQKQASRFEADIERLEAIRQSLLEFRSHHATVLAELKHKGYMNPFEKKARDERLRDEVARAERLRMAPGFRIDDDIPDWTR
jgi:hypothetical protein